MILTDKGHQSCIHTTTLEDRIHLDALRDRTAIVFRRMDKERRGLDLICVFERRHVPKLSLAIIEIVELLLDREVDAIVTGTDHRDPVRDTALASSCFEAVRMTNDPIGQIATLGATGHRQPFRIDRIVRDSTIDEVHKIFIVDPSIVVS